MHSILRFRHFCFLLALFLFSLNAYATHIRAGEITARRMSLTSLTYEITTTLYFDEINGKPAADAQNDVDLYVGSEFLPKILRSSRVNIGNGTSKNTYITTYTFPSTGKYRISFLGENRNNNVLNIGPKPTLDLKFYISTTLEINANLGLNQTPVLLNAPIDLAAVGQRYIHNPGAFDADGDSISYRMVVPQTSLNGKDFSGKRFGISGSKSDWRPRPNGKRSFSRDIQPQSDNRRPHMGCSNG